MKGSIRHKILDQDWEFFPAKYIWDPLNRSVILSDLHLGKTYHFRKNGFAVPKDLAQKNIRALSEILEKHKPKELLILGDLFHSEHNAEWEDLKALRFHYSAVIFHLVMGNHDFFPLIEYKKANLKVSRVFKRDGIVFTHEPIKTKLFNIYGHIHPAIRLKGFALQSLRLPCFFIEKDQMVLPAFGAFTGLYSMKVKAKTKIFAIAEGKIFEAKHRHKAKNKIV